MIVLLRRDDPECDDRKCYFTFRLCDVMVTLKIGSFVHAGISDAV